MLWGRARRGFFLSGPFTHNMMNMKPYEDLLPQHWSPDYKKNFWFVVKLRGNPKRGEKCPN